jgi:hypothetical protein
LKDFPASKKIELIRNSSRKLQIFYKFLQIKKFTKQSNENSEEELNMSERNHKIFSSILASINLYYSSYFIFTIIVLVKIIDSNLIQMCQRFIEIIQRSYIIGLSIENRINTYYDYMGLVDYLDNSFSNIWLKTKADRIIINLPILFYCPCIDTDFKSDECSIVDLSHNYINCTFFHCNCGKNDSKLMISTVAVIKLHLHDCSICLDKFGQDQFVCQLPCRHNFHYSCIYNWFLTENYHCPLCRNYTICKYSLESVM